MKKIIIIVTLISSIFISGCAVIEDVWDSLDVFTEVDTFNDPKLIQREDSVEKNKEELIIKMNESMVQKDFKNAESFVDSNLDNYTQEELDEIWTKLYSQLMADYYENADKYDELLFYMRDNNVKMSDIENTILHSQDAKIIALYQNMTNSHFKIAPGIGETYVMELGQTFVIPDLMYYIEKYGDKMSEEFILSIKLNLYSYEPIFNSKESRFDIKLLVDSILNVDEYYHKYPQEYGGLTDSSNEIYAILGIHTYQGMFDVDGNKYEESELEFQRLISTLRHEEIKNYLIEGWALITANENKVNEKNNEALYAIMEKIIAVEE